MTTCIELASTIPLITAKSPLCIHLLVVPFKIVIISSLLGIVGLVPRILHFIYIIYKFSYFKLIQAKLIISVKLEK